MPLRQSKGCDKNKSNILKTTNNEKDHHPGSPRPHGQRRHVCTRAGKHRTTRESHQRTHRKSRRTHGKRLQPRRRQAESLRRDLHSLPERNVRHQPNARRVKATRARRRRQGIHRRRGPDQNPREFRTSGKTDSHHAEAPRSAKEVRRGTLQNAHTAASPQSAQPTATLRQPRRRTAARRTAARRTARPATVSR